MKRWSLIVALLWLVGACQPAPTPSPTPLPSPTASPTADALAAVPHPMEPNAYWVPNPASGARLYVKVVHPENWTGGALPALVLVPAGLGDSNIFSQPPSTAQAMADRGLTVVIFDPDGRGRSEGVEDENGFIQQDGLAAVVRFAAALPEVDATRIGMAAYSYGLIMASGALARHADLPVFFLIDWEGAVDRYTAGLCYDPSVGHGCDDEAFWGGRESATFARQLGVAYQRVQAQPDHANADALHALRMIANATAQAHGGAGMSPWTRLNDLPPNTVYDAANPPSLPPSSRDLTAQMVGYALELFELFAPPSN